MNKLSSFDITVISRELDISLKDFRINNIYQLNEKTLLLNLRKPEGKRIDLLVEAGVEIHTTLYVFKKPPKPPDFCMALRKYLRGGWVKAVRQHDFERIIELIVESRDEEYRLIIELFSEGNIILVNPEGKILHALVYKRMKDRNIIRGETFKYPPIRGRDPSEISRRDLEKIREIGHISVIRSLVRILGIGGKYAEEILARADINKDKLSSELKDEELDSIYESLQDLLSEIQSGKWKPTVFVNEDGEWIDVAPVEMKKYSRLKLIHFETFNQALDEFYTKKIVKRKTSGIEEEIKRQIYKLERILKYQKDILQKSLEKAEIYRRIGEAIYLHLNEIQFLLQRIMDEKRSGKDWKGIMDKILKEKAEMRAPAIYFEDLDSKNMMLRVSIEGLKFDLNLRDSAQRNASQYYEKAKKTEKKAKGAAEALKQTEARIEELKRRREETVKHALEKPLKVRKKEWYEKFRWFYSSDSFLVIGGRDKAQNNLIIRRYMEPHDLIFHAEIVGAPFVLLKTEGKSPPENTIYEAAQFAGAYSRAWRERLGSVDVYWVRPSQVSLSPPSGEYLPKGAFMIYGSRNYIRNIPLEISIGVARRNNHLQIIGGPPTAISKQALTYVKIVPGDEASSRLSKRIKEILMKALPEEEGRILQKIPLEEIQKFIPSGKGSISRD